LKQTKLSYDDVLLEPQKSSVESLSNVDTTVELAGIELEAPMLSAPMDTVTEREMAEEIADQGGLGVVHRFLEPSEQAEHIQGISPVAGAVGLNEYDRVEELIDNDVDIIVADIAHGHHEPFIDYIEDITGSYDYLLLLVTWLQLRVQMI